MRRGLVVAALTAVGCQFDGGLGTGFLCPTGECPAGQVCEDGVCTLGGSVDAAADQDSGEGSDAGATVDASVGPNLVTNPGMEDGIDPWTPYNAALSETGNPHGGTQALLVCNAGDTGDFTVYQDVLKSPGDAIPEGQGYTASFWVHAPAPGVGPPTMRLTIRESGGAMVPGDHDGPLVSGPDTDWIRLQASGTVQESDRENLILIVWGLESNGGDCFAADDAVLRAE